MAWVKKKFKVGMASNSSSVVMCCIIFYIRLPNNISKRQAGRVNGQISDRVEIWTPNFQLQYPDDPALLKEPHNCA